MSSDPVGSLTIVPIRNAGPSEMSYGLNLLSNLADCYGRDFSSSAKIRKECEVVETELEGERIPGFEVGGELRLCLLRVFAQVLVDFSAEEIGSVCDALHMHLAPCSAAQLAALKQFCVLPVDAQRCGLITKTDAERLCNALLRRSSVASDSNHLHFVRDYIKVVHECFGGCQGLLMMEKYNSPQSQCIQCCECAGMFSPSQFVSHCHEDPERRACHWGFDSAHWRSYILLSTDHCHSDVNKAMSIMEEFRSKFTEINAIKKDKEEAEISTSSKQPGTVVTSEEDAAGCSSSTSDDSGVVKKSSLSEHSPQSVAKCLDLVRQLSKSFASCCTTDTLPPYLHTGQPVLVQSENVASHFTEQHRSDPSFTPNVSLKPEPYAKLRAQYPELLSVEDDGDARAAERTIPKLERQGALLPFKSPASDHVRDDDDDDDEDDENSSCDTQSVTSDKCMCIVTVVNMAMIQL